MSMFFADLVREVSHAAGAGDLALEGALPGHRRFADVVPPGARFHYAIAGVSTPGEWEVGEGELGSDGSLLRVALASSSGGARVAFSPGLKIVALTVCAAWYEGQEGVADTVADLAMALAEKADLAGAAFAGPVSAASLDVAGDCRVGGAKVVGSRRTGWAIPTGTAARTSFDTGGISTAQLAQRVKALIEDLAAHGLIGA